jgi:short-subunit dehydrogenase involved in D-alanine esterification of teichoic acids
VSLVDSHINLRLIRRLGSEIGRLLAKGFAGNGSKTVLVDINKEFLAEAKLKSEKLAGSVDRVADVYTYARKQPSWSTKS